MKKNFKKLINVTFVINNTPMKTSKFVIIVISLENTAVQLIKNCNLKLRIKPEEIKIPVIFHNLRGYDSHWGGQRSSWRQDVFSIAR